MIFQRYVLRSLAAHWLVFFLGLMTIITIGQVPLILGRAAEHELAQQLVFKVLLLMLVAQAPIGILLTLLLAIVVTIGRLTSDGELTAMRAVGFSPLNLLAVITAFSIPVVALLAFTTNEFSPLAYCKAVLARADATRNLMSAPVRPGVFVPLGERGTLLANEVAADGEMRHVFVSVDRQGLIGVLTAERGRIRADPSGDQFFLALYDGELYEGIPRERRFRIVRFRELTRPITFPLESQTCVRPDTRATRALWGSTSRRDIAELNQRFGHLALAIAVVLIGVPLSITRPRKGALSRVPAAIGLFAVSMFGIAGLSTWSARDPVLGTAVLWSVLTFAVGASALWLSAIQRGRLFR